ncbi:MAG: hypothetical protein ABIO83_05125 [Ilumatobacteraceae bacterium]
MSEDETLQLIADTYPTLDKWRRLAAEGIVITHGSELQLQDVEWSYVPSSTVALVGLAAAREHLHAIRLLIAARELFPSATATLARAALEGAAQTVWMLAPDDHAERMRRSLSIVREDYRHHRNFGEFAATADTVEKNPTADEQTGRLRDRFDAVTALADQYGGATLRIVVATDVLPAAVEATTSEKPFREHALSFDGGRWQARRTRCSGRTTDTPGRAHTRSTRRASATTSTAATSSSSEWTTSAPTTSLRAAGDCSRSAQAAPT